MSYEAEISRNNPTAFLFVLDRSGSMSESTPEGMQKAQMLSDVINRLLSELILKCSKTEGIRNYFEIGVIGYDSATGIVNLLPGELVGSWLNPVSLFETNQLRSEERKKKIPDGAGGVIEQPIHFPVWFDPVSQGGTSTCAALTMAYDILNPWCANHPTAYPPLLVHVTDGQSTDGDPEGIARDIQELSTEDGNVLMFNIHLSKQGDREMMFPSTVQSLPDTFAEKLFRMSSQLPEKIVELAIKEEIVGVSTESHGFAYQVSDLVSLVTFLEIGTRAAKDIVELDQNSNPSRLVNRQTDTSNSFQLSTDKTSNFRRSYQTINTSSNVQPNVQEAIQNLKVFREKREQKGKLRELNIQIAEVFLFYVSVKWGKNYINPTGIPRTDYDHYRSEDSCLREAIPQYSTEEADYADIKKSAIGSSLYELFLEILKQKGLKEKSASLEQRCIAWLEARKEQIKQRTNRNN